MDPMNPWLPVTNTMDVADAVRRTRDDAEALRLKVDKVHRHLDMRQLILSRIPHPGAAVDSAAVDAWSSVNESVRARNGGNIASGTWVPLAALADPAQRKLTAGVATAGGNLTAPRVAAEVGASLLPDSAIMGAGAQLLTGFTGGSVALPTISNAVDASSAWVPEGGDAIISEPAFGATVVKPHTVAVQVTITRRLLANAGVDVSGLLRQELSQRLAAAIDAAAVAGSGTEHRPQGLLHHPGIEVLEAGPNGALPTWERICEAESAVADRVGSTDGQVWVTSPKLRKRIRLTSHVSGSGPVLMMEGRELLGRRVIASPNVPSNLVKGSSGASCSALIFGDLREVTIAFWGAAAVDILVDPYTKLHEHKVRIIARADLDIAVRRPGAFAMYQDFLLA